MMKPFPQQGLIPGKRIYNYRHNRARRISENLFGIVANRWRIYFTIINLDPKHVENIIFTTLILHNMLIKSSFSANVYRPAFFADTILENGEIVAGEWRDNQSNDSLYELQVPRSGHNASIAAKSVRETFMDYFVSDGAVEWQWKYC